MAKGFVSQVVSHSEEFLLGERRIGTLGEKDGDVGAKRNKKMGKDGDVGAKRNKKRHKT